MHNEPRYLLAHSAMPGTLLEAIDRMKIADSLLHTLDIIEQVAWEDHLNGAEGRAKAFAICALVYGDLSDSDHDALDKHIRERVAARRKWLQEQFKNPA